MEIQRMAIAKVDAPKRIVRGVVLEPDVIDTQRDIMKADDVESAAHGFLINVQRTGAAIDVDHTMTPRDIAIVESFVAPVDYVEGGQPIRKGSWVLAVKVYADDVWESVLAGERNAFSIHGEGTRTPVRG